MAQTESQKRAKLKYDKKTYKTITCKCKIADYNKFDIYAKQLNISSMSNLIYRCLNYCTNNNIDLNNTDTLYNFKVTNSK